MARQIVTKKDFQQAQIQAARAASGLAAGEAPAVEPPDKYSDRLIKFIPTEIIAAFLTIQSLVQSAPADFPLQNVMWIVFIFLLILTPLYLWRVQNVNKRVQLGISTVSYAVWVFTLGGPFAFFDWYNTLYGAIILPLFTLLVAVIKPEE